MHVQQQVPHRTSSSLPPSSLHEHHNLSHLNMSPPFQNGQGGIAHSIRALPGSPHITQLQLPLQRESQQPQSQFTAQPHSGALPPGLSPASVAHPSLASSQPLPLNQPVLQSHQPPQPPFGAFSNLPGVVLPVSAGEEQGAAAHHLGNSHSGESFSGTYAWDAPSAQNAAPPPNLSEAQYQQQPLLPLHRVSDSRSNTNPNVSGTTSGPACANSANNHASFSGALTGSTGILEPPLSNPVVSSLLNGAALASNAGVSGSTVPLGVGSNGGSCGGSLRGNGGAPETNGVLGNASILPASQGFSSSCGATRRLPTASISTSRAQHLKRENIIPESRGGMTVRGHDRPVKKVRLGASRKFESQGTRSNQETPRTPSSLSSPVQGLTSKTVGAALASQSSATDGNRPSRTARGGKAKGRGRCREVGLEPACGAAVISKACKAQENSAAQKADAMDSKLVQNVEDTFTLPKLNAVQLECDVASVLMAAPTSTSIPRTASMGMARDDKSLAKASSPRSKSRRRARDGPPTVTVPVHLRNPKKGRARVFRECELCRCENHIRRSDCIQCKAPLPAGKRRRDGNPSYERKSRNRSPKLNSRVAGWNSRGDNGATSKDGFRAPRSD